MFFDQLITETIEEVRPLAQEKEIEVQPDVGPLTPIICDGVRLGQVLRNYLTNAVKFSRKNSTIIVRVREETDFIKVSVIDEGRGISDFEKQSLFAKCN